MSEKKYTATGDSHGGKCVMLVTDGSEKYFIKPKSADIQSALEAFLTQLSRKGFPFVPKCEKMLEIGSGYYKTGFVENTQAESLDDVAEYYKRCGSLIFFTYMLSSADLHCENIIACKNSPVLIDVENIISGNIAKPDAFNTEILGNSVLASSLLPHWKTFDTEKKQCGGLCSDDINSPSTLKFNNAVTHIYDYVDEVVYGFRCAYEFALKNKSVIIDMLKSFSDCNFRILLRHTDTYAKIIDAVSQTPDDEKRTFAAKLLEFAYIRDFRKNRLEYMRKVCDAEIDGVLHGDIPCFYVRGNGVDLCGNGEALAEKFFSDSPLGFTEKKINSLSHDDLEAQIKIIELSLSCVKPVSLKKRVVHKSDDIYSIIYKKLESGCVPSLPSSWIMLDNSAAGTYIKSVDNGLYGGLAGILCAYAAFYRKTRNQIYLDALLRHYQPLSDYIRRRNHPVPLKSHAACLQDGAAGIISALLHISELTGEEIFRNDALKVASLICVDGEAEGGDILGGTAGLALCLDKLPEKISVPIAEKLITPLSESLPGLTGMAHGMAGTALAIAALQNVLGINSFDFLILRLLEKENSFYSDEHGNWQDLRNSDGIYFMNGWCAGAPGIGMARKRILQLTGNEKTTAICKNDIERVRKNLCSDTVLKRDGLCCGNSSRLMACSALGINNERLFAVLCNKVKTDTLNFDNINGSCSEDYSLMQGLAGAGYVLALQNDEKCGGMLL